jgi:hypothetical protein
VEHNIPKAGLKSGEETASEKGLFSMNWICGFFKSNIAINIP